MQTHMLPELNKLNRDGYKILLQPTQKITLEPLLDLRKIASPSLLFVSALIIYSILMECYTIANDLTFLKWRNLIDWLK